nr:redoxin domain-containing protein [Aeribacillus pallidus]
MKKAVTMILLVGLLGWTVYDTVFKGKPSSSIDNSSSSYVEGINKGNRAPDFKLQTLDGQTVALSDFRGKKVIVNMWATWCPPCRAEMPDMQKFYEKYKDEGVEILAVNLTQAEKNKEDVARFLKDYGITFTVVLDEMGEVSEKYQAQAIPTSYLIDSKGFIREKITGPMSYDWMVEKIASME